MRAKLNSVFSFFSSVSFSPFLEHFVHSSAISQYERQPVDDVEYEEEYGEGDEEELVYPPVFLRQLLQRHGRRGRPLLHLVLEVVLAHDLDVHAVLAGDVALLLEQDGGVPERRNRKMITVMWGWV